MEKFKYFLRFLQAGLAIFNLKGIYCTLSAWYGWEVAIEFIGMISLYYLWRYTGNTGKLYNWCYITVRVVAIFISVLPVYNECGFCVKTLVFIISTILLDLSFELKFEKQ